MKNKVIAGIILLTTTSLITSIGIWINRIPRDKPSQKGMGIIDTAQGPEARTSRGPSFKPMREARPVEEVRDSAPAGDGQAWPMKAEDIEKIKGIAKLSEQDLMEELNSLKDILQKEHVFENYESMELSEAEEVKARDILERFALLGLELGRRKFMAIEPELRDPLVAHRESLAEIRELLDDR